MSFNIFGIDFKISYYFAVTVALFIAVDKTGNILPFLMATLLHEAGHIVCMMLVKAKPKEIVLAPGTIRIVNNSVTTNNENLLILLGGPLVNLILFLSFIYFKAFQIFALINLVLFLFNLLPIEGLDGGSILKLALGIKHSAKYADRVLFIITLIFAAGLIFAFVALIVNGTVNYSLPILVLYLLLPLFIKKLC